MTTSEAPTGMPVPAGVDRRSESAAMLCAQAEASQRRFWASVLCSALHGLAEAADPLCPWLAQQLKTPAMPAQGLHSGDPSIAEVLLSRQRQRHARRILSMGWFLPGRTLSNKLWWSCRCGASSSVSCARSRRCRRPHRQTWRNCGCSTRRLAAARPRACTLPPQFSITMTPTLMT